MKRARTVIALVTAVVGALIATFSGVELPFAIAWGLLAGVFVLCTQVVMPEDPRTDGPEIDIPNDRRSTEVSRMAWSLNPSTGTAGEMIARRVRSILAHRLQRRGLDVTDPAQRAAIDALLGAGVWERLVGHGTTRVDIEKALDAIDRLSPSEPQTSTTSNTSKEKQ